MVATTDSWWMVVDDWGVVVVGDDYKNRWPIDGHWRRWSVNMVAIVVVDDP